MITLIVCLVVNAVSFLVIAKLLPGFKVKKPETAFVMAAVYGILMAIVTRVLLAMLVGLLTGLFLLIPFLAILVGVAAYLSSFLVSFLLAVGVLAATDAMLDDFEMDGPATAVIAALMLGVINTLQYAVIHFLL